MTASLAEDRTNTRDSALKAALTNCPSVADAQREIQTAQAGHQQSDLIPNPVLIIDAQAFRENSNTTNVNLRRTPKVCGKSHVRIEVASKSQGVATLELKHRRNDLRLDDRSLLRRHDWTARSDFSSELALTGGTRIASIRKRLNQAGTSTPILYFGRKQRSISSEANGTYQSSDLHNVAELRLRLEIRQAVDKRSKANRETKSFSQVILPAARSAEDANTNCFEIAKLNLPDVLGLPRPRTQDLTSAQLLTFNDESSGSTTTSLTWSPTS
ncbi:hypothetical protein [Pseudomonas fluorescens]|nr:hypothetical protein [Pseudomonas fluorescens]